jgi:hypothetical protein
MQVSLTNAPYIFARNASGRVVQISGRAGDVGRIANVVVPNERVVQKLLPVIRYIEKLPPKQFEYGSLSRYRKYSTRPETPVVQVSPNKLNDLPLFNKF